MAEKKSVPLQITALSYGPKCVILLIVDTVSDSLFWWQLYNYTVLV